MFILYCVSTVYGTGMPQVVFLTRVDRACPMTKANLRNIYNSKKIRDKVGSLAGIHVGMYDDILSYCTDNDT